jgi:carboxylesterase type B
VLFFVYGGDYTVGGPNDEQLYGWRGVKELGDAVFVVPGWRQGIFGNLGGREVKAATVDGSSGTAGFADQQMAMRWAFENVAAFGGDPNRILLFGESAGAAAVSMHLVSEGSWPYFSRAAMQSGAFVHWAYLNTSVAQTIFDFFANYTGCAPEKQREKKKGGGAGTAAAPSALECLQAIPAKRLANDMVREAAHQPFPDGWSNSSYAPQLDGVFLKEIDPLVLLRNGGVKPGVPILLGSNADEGVAFVSTTRTVDNYLSMTISEDGYHAWSSANFAEPWATELVELYSSECSFIYRYILRESCSQFDCSP